MTSAAPPDWTAGTPRLVVYRCQLCGHAWYLPRQACPGCGRTEVTPVVSAGAGVVVASTTVWRRPDVSPDGASPVGIALVDLAEGGRAMGRCRPGTPVGARVRAVFVTEPAGHAEHAEDGEHSKDGGRLLPMFEPEGE